MKRRFRPYVLGFNKKGSAVSILAFGAMGDLSDEEVSNFYLMFVILDQSQESDFFENHPELESVLDHLIALQSVA